MKPSIFAFFVICAVGCGYLSAETRAWQPSSGHTQVPIWPSKVPAAGRGPDLETAATAENLVAGQPWLFVSNVSRPTLTVYSPKEKNNGAAFVVFPGGGYQI